MDIERMFREMLKECRLKMLQKFCRDNGLLIGRNKRDCIDSVMCFGDRIQTSVFLENGVIEISAKRWDSAQTGQNP